MRPIKPCRTAFTNMPRWRPLDLRAWMLHTTMPTPSAVYDRRNECTIGAGASSLIFAAIQALVHPGDEVVVQTPAYDLYAPAVQLAGGQL